MRLPQREFKRVLLVDPNQFKQHMRSAALRNCEIKVDAVGSLNEAEDYLTKYEYDLVLLSAEGDAAAGMTLGSEIAARYPRQRVAVLVGAPHYVREVGNKRRPSEVTVIPSPMAEPVSQPTQWHVMMEQLLSTGMKISALS